MLDGDFCQEIAKTMLRCLEDSEVTKVSMRELKEQVLSPNESSFNIMRFGGKQVMKKARSYFRSLDKERTRS